MNHYPENLIVYGQNPMNNDNMDHRDHDDVPTSTLQLISKINNLNYYRHNFVDEKDVTEYFHRHFKHLIPDDFKQSLNIYYYKKDDDINEIQKMQKLMNVSLKYVLNLEKHTLSVFSSMRSSILESNRYIQRTIRQRGDFILHLERSHTIDCQNESKCLDIMNSLNIPDDMIHIIASYAYTPLLKYIMIKHTCGDVAKRLHTMKSENLKKIVRKIYSHAITIYNYLYRNILPMGSINKRCNTAALNNKIRLNNKKNMVEDVLRILTCFDEIIEYFNRCNSFKKTYNWLLIKIRFVYHCILYVSKPEFNGRLYSSVASV